MYKYELTYRLEDIDKVAKHILNQFDAKTILFDGEMGAGKTTFINALLKAMQSNDTATSPTFSIVNEYNVPNDKVFHFDFYRIENIEEAYNFGIEDYLYSNHWLFIEWADRIEEILPENTQTIIIEKADNTERSLKLTINKKLLTENNAMTEPKF